MLDDITMFEATFAPKRLTMIIDCLFSSVQLVMYIR